MPDLTKKQLKAIQERIETAVKAKDRNSWYDTVKRMREIYKGKMWPGQSQYSDVWQENSDHQVTVNLAQVNTDIIVSSIAYADPEFQLTPQEPGAAANAQYQKAALTKVWNEIGALQQERRRLKESVIAGVGVNFVGWRYEEQDMEPQEGTRPDYLPQEGPLPTLIGAGGELTAPPEEPAPVSAVKVVYDNPTVRCVDPVKFFVDPDHDDLDDLRDAQFVLEEKIVPERAIKGNKRYKNTQDLKGDTRIAVDSNERDRDEQRKSKSKLLKIYEYWQKDGRKHIIYADGKWESPILEETWPYRYSTYPYTTLVFRSIPDEQFPQGAIEPAVTSIQAYSLYRTRQVQHDDVSSRCLTGVDMTKVSEDGLKVLRSGTVEAIIEVNAPPGDAIVPIKPSALPQEFYVTQSEIKGDTDITMAVNDYLRGSPDKTRRTLGEVNLTVSLSASRGQLLQRDFERACEKDANLVLTLLQDERFCDRKRWLVMTGEGEQRETGLDWNADTIQGQSDVRVICNSTRAQTPESIQQTMGFALQSLQPYVQAGQVNIAPFLRKFGQSINMTPQELAEIMQGGGQQGQGEQQMQQVTQVIQGMGQSLQQVMQAVEELKAQLGQGAVDQKTQIDLAAKQQAMQTDAQKSALELQIMQAKAQQELDAAQAELALSIEIARQKMAIEEQEAKVGEAIRIKEQSQRQKAKATAKTSGSGSTGS